MAIWNTVNRAVVIAALTATALVAADLALAAPTAEQKCEAAKIKAAGSYSFCRMKAEAQVAERGGVPDFSNCDDNLAKTFAKAESKFGAFCAFADIVLVDGLMKRIARESGDMACRLRKGAFTRRTDRGGSIAFVDFFADTSNDAALAVRNTANLPIAHARCFYVDNSGPCTVSPEFLVDIPARDQVEWSASQGSVSIPPVASLPFAGSLVCVELDDSGVPFAGNQLVASVTPAGECGQDGFAISALDGGVPLNQDFALCLGNATAPNCPLAEYDPCPVSRAAEIASCWNLSPTFTFVCQ